jgi:P-type Mg2+ transporter
MTKADFWKQPIAELFAELASSNEGLTSREAASRLLRYGSNDATAPKRAPAWLRFTRHFANPLILVLLLASALSAASGDLASFMVIVAIVLLSVLLDFVQESQAQNAVDALRDQVALRADVRRDGADTSLPVAQLVPGDVVRLAAGDLVPADGVLLTGRDFFVNQALLTGESYPVEKHGAKQGDPAALITDALSVALAGTSVVSGSATFLVCHTGRNTALGKIADTLIRKPPPTSFEIGLRRFSMLILRIALVLILLVMAESMAFHRPWIDSLVFALALAVGLTPAPSAHDHDNQPGAWRRSDVA